MTFETRTWLELCVGNTHILQVLVHIRKEDLLWWNENQVEFQRELLGILSRQVIPVECKEEMEQYSKYEQKSAKYSMNKSSRKKKEQGKPQMLHDHTQQKLQFTTDSNTSKRSSKKSSRKSSSHDKVGEKGSSLKSNPSSKARKNKKESFPAIATKYSKHIRLMYRVEQIEGSHSATLLFTNKNKNDAATNILKAENEGTRKSLKRKIDSCNSESTSRKRLSSFRSLVNMKTRIIVWVFPWDAMNPNLEYLEEDIPDKEMLPLSSTAFSD